MTKRKLKDWVLPALAIIVLIGAIFSYYLISNLLNYSVTNDLSYITDPVVEKTEEVNNEVTEEKVTPIKPYASENVNVSKYFYRQEDDEKKQQSSLIKYENIYMPNTGILYSSTEKFDCVASLSGKVTKIKEDKIMGQIIEIEHSNDLVLVYQSLSDIQVKEGDTVNQGDIIAASGANKLADEKENCLHFEVYKEGNLLNPEEFYKLEV